MFEVVIKTQKGTAVSTLRCVEEICSVGKHKDNAIALHGWKVARRHAELVRRDDGVYVREVDGNAIVYINDAKLDEQYGPIGTDDVIRIGDYQLRVRTHAQQSERTRSVDPAPAAADARVPQPSMANVDDAVLAQRGEQNRQKLQQEASRWRSAIHRQLFDLMDLRRINVSAMSDEELRRFTADAIGQIIDGLDDFPTTLDKTNIAAEVLAEAVGLGPLESLIARDDVSEIMVNAADEIFFESEGRLTRSDITFTDDQSVLRAIERIVAPLGRRIDESSPMVDARLKDGSRVNAIIPPLALKGPSITIRKFMQERLGAEHLMRFGSLNQAMVDFLQIVVEKKCNVVISGGTGSGKTTLLNVLSSFIPDRERIVTVEDAAELKLSQSNLVSLEARPPNQEGKGHVTIRDLVKNCLRMRPDRIVVGECRGGEALDMLQAMNTGHDGSLTTIHANSPRDCIARMEVLVLMSGMDLPVAAIREQIASAIDIVVQQTRFACGSRRITSISEITGMEGGTVQIAELFRFQQEGYDENGRVRGRFVATGLIPEFYEELSAQGVELDLSIFGEARSS